MTDSLVWRLIMRDDSEPGASAFRKTLEKVRGDTERHSNAFAKAGEITGGFSKAVMKSSAVLGTASTTLVNGAGAAVAFAHSAATMSGALLLVPGAIAAVGVANVTLKVGLSGVKDAFAAAGKDTKAYEEALKELSPEQAKFVRAAVDQKDAWDKVKKATGDRLFRDLSAGVSSLATTYLPLIKSGLGDMADGFNDAAVDIGIWAMKKDVIAKFNNVLHDSADIVGNVLKGARPLGNALLNIFSASIGSLTNYTGGFQKFANRFDDFIYRVTDNGQGGQFAVWIKNGTAEISNITNKIGALISKAKDPAFQSTLITVWQGMQKSAAAVNKELPLVIQAVTAMAPAFANVLAAGGTSFGATLHTVATMAIALAPTLNAVSAALLPMAPLLGAISPYLFLAAKGMQAWSVVGPIAKAVRTWTVAQGGLNAVLLANPIGLTVVAIAAFVAILVVAYKKSDTFHYAVNRAFKAVASTILSVMQANVDAFGSLFAVMGKLPGKAGAPFRALARAAEAASKKLDGVRAAVNRIPTKKTINVTVSTHATGGNSAVEGYGLGYLMRADGGPVKAGQSYIVGERRPELFVPDQDGQIIPRVPSEAAGHRGYGGAGGGGVVIQLHLNGPTVGSMRELREAVTEAWHAAPAGAKRMPARAVGAH